MPTHAQGSASSHAPEYAGTCDVVPPEIPGGGYRVMIPRSLRGEFALIVECAANGFSFEKHCRHAYRKDPAAPYTFSSFQFGNGPDGIRVGPWPGWRGIPHIPALTVRYGSQNVETRPSFWGDEVQCLRLRFTGQVECDGTEELVLSSAEESIVPEKVKLYRASPLRASDRDVILRPDLEGVHPRLLITPDTLPLLREEAHGARCAQWARIEAVCASWDLPFEKNPESKTVPGIERLSSEDRVLLSAFIALVVPDPANIARALHSYHAYSAETAAADFEPLRIDTQAGEVLFILAIGYDWLAPSMSSGERTAARQRLGEIAEICFAHLGYQRRDYGQAHFLGCGLGLWAFSFLFWEEDPRVRTWARWLRGALDCALQLVPEDGFYPHGINLWNYEFGFLLRWIEVLRTCTGEDLWSAYPRLANVSRFRAATLSPDALFGITFGDPQYRTGGDSWCHYLIAARTGSREAQWLGTILADLPHTGVDFRSIPARRRIYEFLFLDPRIEARPADTGVRVFGDGGQVCLRTASTLFTLRSGPPLGLQRYALGEYGAYGHSDPANGSFLLYRNGEFVANGSGPVYRRDTALHNVVTIDGQGQIGDSAVWLPDFFPPDVLAARPGVREGGASLEIAVDLTPAYHRHLGVRRYHRAVCVSPDAFIAGVDLISCDGRHSIEWNAHSWSEFVPALSGDIVGFDLCGNVRLTLFAPPSVVWSSGLTAFVPAYPNNGTRDYHLVGRVSAAEVRFVWCYGFAPSADLRIIAGNGSSLRIGMSDGTRLTFDGQWLSNEGHP